MTKRNIHYEAAFEDYLRKKEIPYIAINEAKRSIVEGKPIKNFDFFGNEEDQISANFGFILK